MSRDELLSVLGAFEAAGLEYVLIGATAMAFHGVVRATEDVDLFVRATPENIERLRTALRTVYDDPNIDAITHELHHRVLHQDRQSRSVGRRAGAGSSDQITGAA